MCCTNPFSHLWGEGVSTNAVRGGGHAYIPLPRKHTSQRPGCSDHSCLESYVLALPDCMCRAQHLCTGQKYKSALMKWPTVGDFQLTSPNLKPFEFTYLMTGSRPLYTRSFCQERVIPTHCLLAALTPENVTCLRLLYHQHPYGLPNNLRVCALNT